MLSSRKRTRSPVTSQATSAPAPVDVREVCHRVHAAVAAVAATEPDPLDPFRGLYISDESALRTTRQASLEAAAPALGAAVELLGLGPLDAALLALCAAPELDASYGRLLAYLHDDVTRRSATPRLAARLLAGEGLSGQTVLSRFGTTEPLRRSGAVRLVDDDPLVPLADRRVKLDERLVARLLGVDLAAPDGTGTTRLVPRPVVDPGRAEAADTLRRVTAGEARLPLVVCGADGPALVAWAVERPVLLLDARSASDATALAAARMHAALEGAELVLEVPEPLRPEDKAHVRGSIELVRDTAGRVLLCVHRREDVVTLDGLAAMLVDVPPPSLPERRRLWQALVNGDGARVEEAATKFRLSLGQIEHAARVAAVTGDLEQGAREASRTRLAELATLLDGRRYWDDLVLPEAQREQLRSISAYLRHRDQVLTEWGFGANAPSQGLNVLFAGESGTGKTMAAQVIATDLGLDVYRVDLASIVSKYIGETERNLHRIFADAEGSNAILFFDEADALFGKRSEVKDAHDRYANIEVSYLLQRMDSYPGAVVLATNYRRNIDEAFLRRLDFVIEFPFPEPADRVRIWKRLLPDAAPVSPDVDVEELAARFELAGGSIANCSMSAAFMAADDGGAIEMQHLVRAVAAEYRKVGRLTLDAEFGAPGA